MSTKCAKRRSVSVCDTCNCLSDPRDRHNEYCMKSGIDECVTKGIGVRECVIKGINGHIISVLMDMHVREVVTSSSQVLSHQHSQAEILAGFVIKGIDGCVFKNYKVY